MCGFDKKHPLNHVVTLFAYVNNDKGEDYWMARNSWGEDDVQFNLKFTTNDNDNACGLRKKVFSVYRSSKKMRRFTK